MFLIKIYNQIQQLVNKYSPGFDICRIETFKRGAQKLLNYISANGIKRCIDCISLEIPTLNRYFMFPHIIKTPVYGPGSLDTDTDIQTDNSFLANSL